MAVNGKFSNSENHQKDFTCSIGFAMTVIGSKWRAVILWHILKEPHIRYSRLKKQIPNISDKILAQELHCLLENALIERIAFAQVPPRVEYIPTERGRSLQEILIKLCEWGKKMGRDFK